MLVDHHPFQDARIFKKEAKSLLNLGYDVTLVVPRKDGFLFGIDGTVYKKDFLEPSFMYEGIKIVTYNKVPIKSLDSLVTNLKSNEINNFKDPLTEAGLAQSADIYHAHELLSFYSGVAIKRIMEKKYQKKVKLIYDSHEIVPDPFSPKSEKKKAILHKLLVLMLREVNYVITVSDSIKAWYLSIDPLLVVDVLYNSPPLPPNRKLSKDKRKFTICYVGNISNEKGEFEKILQIVDNCSEKMEVNFKIIGGPRVGENLVVPNSMKGKISFIGWVEYESIYQHLEDVDIGWIDFSLIDKSLNRTFALPNKFFSFLSSGIPVIVNKCYEMEKILNDYRCGVAVDKTFVSGYEYSKKIIDFYKKPQKLKEMGENARRIMEEKYCWGVMEKKLEKIYLKL